MAKSTLWYVTVFEQHSHGKSLVTAFRLVDACEVVTFFTKDSYELIRTAFVHPRSGWRVEQEGTLHFCFFPEEKVPESIVFNRKLRISRMSSERVRIWPLRIQNGDAEIYTSILENKAGWTDEWIWLTDLWKLATHAD